MSPLISILSKSQDNIGQDRTRFYPFSVKYSLHLLLWVITQNIKKTPQLRHFVVITGIFIKKHDTGVEPVTINVITVVFTAFADGVKNVRTR